MACRARPCFFLPGRSTNSVLFLMVRAAASWQKCMRNTFEPSRFQASGNCLTWIRVTTCSSCRHMLRGAAVQVCRADAFRRADFAARNYCLSLLSPSPPPFSYFSPSSSFFLSFFSSPLRTLLASSLHRVCLSSHRAICSCLIFGPNCQFFGTNLRLCTMKNALSSLAIDRDLGFC